MDDRTNARARALRAARVVTLGLALSAAPACGASTHAALDSGSPPDGGGTADSGSIGEDSGSAVDSGTIAEDSGALADSGSAADSGTIAEDSGVLADAGGNADAGTLACPDIFPPTSRECCEAYPGGFWDESSMSCVVAVPGPFVPPEVAHV